MASEIGPWRAGKTARDRDSGALARNIENKTEREEWMRSSGKSNKFPSHTCNGKRNRQKK